MAGDWGHAARTRGPGAARAAPLRGRGRVRAATAALYPLQPAPRGGPTLLACRLLIDRGDHVRLRIVGAGEMKDAPRRHIAEVGLDERVELLGARSQDEVIELYRTATVFTLPCVVLDNGDRDGIPNVLVEAMRLGLPVVSTAVSGIPELVVDEETGLLVPPRDTEALASALARLPDDAELRARRAAGAAHRV